MKERRTFTAADVAAGPAGESRPNSGRSISQILQEIVARVSEIIRSEVRLAKTEVQQDLSERARAAVIIAVAALLVGLALAFLLLGAVYALALTMPAWQSALIVGGVVGILGGILLYLGQAKMKQSPKLQMTARTAEDNIRWLKNQAK